VDDLASFVADMELSTGSLDGEANGVAERVAEFVPLNRRQSSGNSPLDPAELERWAELREQLEYHFSTSNPPLDATCRRVLRVPTDLKACCSGDAVAVLHNLSECGAFVESSQQLTPGASLELEIDPGGGEPPLHLAAIVKWERELPNMDGPAGVGVEFVNLEDGDSPALGRLVDSLLAAASPHRD